jgi:hypothetical protein
VDSNYKPDSSVPTLTKASICSSGAIKNEFRDIRFARHTQQALCPQLWRTAATLSRQYRPNSQHSSTATPGCEPPNFELAPHRRRFFHPKFKIRNLKSPMPLLSLLLLLLLLPFRCRCRFFHLKFQI